MKFAGKLIAATLVFGLTLAAFADGPADSEAEAKREKLRIAVQGICPVSGQKLGSHGAPIKVKVGKDKEEVFLCCKGCLKGKLDAKHWATIHANIAKAQQICPIMKKELPKNPKWTILRGQVVYICCPPCTKKLAADPEPHLKKIDAFYAKSLQSNLRR